jgi:hypothetical protein
MVNRRASLKDTVTQERFNAKISTHFVISIAVLENVPPDTGLQNRATFSTLNVGLAGTGNQSRATCTNRSAIYYATCACICL